MPAAPLHLRALAERAGVLPRYVDIDHRVRETSDETRRLLLACLGFDAGDEAAARRTLERLDAEQAARIVDPVRVARENDAGQIVASSPALVPGALRYEVETVDEASGRRGTARGTARVRSGGMVAGLRGPSLGPGTYRTSICLESGGVRKTVEQWLAVAPATCTTLAEVIGRRRVYGIWSNLYAVRSARGLGVGNFADLERVVKLAGGAGAEFVGINPLHALRNRGLEVSPYSPTSRLFRNPIYVALERVPELAGSDAARKLMGTPAFARELERVRAAGHVEYERVAALHAKAMEALWRTFREGAPAARRRAFERYRSVEGVPLRDFATFCAIEEKQGATNGVRDWRRWPAALRDCASATVAAFRERNAERVEYYAFVQFECDRQLAAAARAAERAGMAIGLYSDLAVGSIASGFDAWAFRECFVDGAALGAPPDPYSATGQNWALPPLNPHKLRADGYRYWRAMLRAAFRHCGMLRLDHAMGVLRQFWIPDGHSGVDGAYVTFPASDLLGLLTLASRTEGTVVVGEDLGTVPEGFGELLAGRAILSSNVMFFQRTPGGGFVGARAYSPRALLTANTHDQPTVAGWWRGRDLEIRRRVGMIENDAELARARVKREREKALLVRRLRTERALVGAADAQRPAQLSAAVHRYLCAAPSPLLGVSLDDVAGETEPVNVPGIPVDRFPSWSRRMRAPVEELAGDADVACVLDGVQGRARKRAGATRTKRRRPL